MNDVESEKKDNKLDIHDSRAVVVHLNFRAGSTFPFQVCTVSPGHWANKAETK